MSIAEIMKLLPGFVSIDSPPRPCSEIIAEICIAQKWHANDADALAQGEKWEKQVIRKIASQSASDDPFGRLFGCTINSSSPDMVQGLAFIETSDSPLLQQEKAQIARIDHYVQAFAKLTPEEFEGLCAGILDLLGVNEPKITPKTRDEGIDFYGRLSLEEMFRGTRVFPGSERQYSVWMIGQAKHFGDNQVSTLNVRELVGSATLARSRAYSTRQDTRYLDLTIRASDPIFCLFFTTGEISRDAWSLLGKSGVIGMDGNMVAQLLAERDIALVNDQFDITAFEDWVKQSGTVST